MQDIAGDHLSHQRWLIDNGFINDLHKDNLYMYGAIVHRDIEAVEVRIDMSTKTIAYDIYAPTRLLRKMNKYFILSRSNSIIGLWRFKRMLKREGNLNITNLLSKFVKDYLGPKWGVEVNLKDIKAYEEGFKQDQPDVGNVDNKQANV